MVDFPEVITIPVKTGSFDGYVSSVLSCAFEQLADERRLLEEQILELDNSFTLLDESPDFIAVEKALRKSAEVFKSIIHKIHTDEISVDEQLRNFVVGIEKLVGYKEDPRASSVTEHFEAIISEAIRLDLRLTDESVNILMAPVIERAKSGNSTDLKAFQASLKAILEHISKHIANKSSIVGSTEVFEAIHNLYCGVWPYCKGPKHQE